jgi:hypothetical protein
MAQPVQAHKLDLTEIEFNMHKGKLYLNDTLTKQALELEIGSFQDMLRAPFGLSNKFNAEATFTSLELEPSDELEAVMNKLFEKLINEVADRAKEVLGEVLFKNKVSELFNNPLHATDRGKLLRIKIGDSCPVFRPTEQTEEGMKVERLELSDVTKGCMVAAQVRLSSVWVMRRRGAIDQWGIGLYTDALFVKPSPTPPRAQDLPSFGKIKLVY